MVEVPAETAVTRPEAIPILATAGVLLAHRPPGVPSVRVVVVPMQPLVVPFMAPGTAFTVTFDVAVQPADNV